jgi:hypothetical protein
METTNGSPRQAQAPAEAGRRAWFGFRVRTGAGRWAFRPPRCGATCACWAGRARSSASTAAASGSTCGTAAALKSHTSRDRVLLHPESKLAIARCAASLCRDGDTILIGGGTTASGMAAFLADRRMRVLTNSFEVARQLLEASENEVIVSGGRIYAEQDIILSPFDTEAVQYCYADKLFIGVHALSALGLREGRSLAGAGRQAFDPPGPAGSSCLQIHPSSPTGTACSCAASTRFPASSPIPVSPRGRADAGAGRYRGQAGVLRRAIPLPKSREYQAAVA